MDGSTILSRPLTPDDVAAGSVVLDLSLIHI